MLTLDDISEFGPELKREPEATHAHVLNVAAGHPPGNIRSAIERCPDKSILAVFDSEARPVKVIGVAGKELAHEPPGIGHIFLTPVGGQTVAVFAERKES